MSADSPPKTVLGGNSADELLASYYAGELDRVELLYTSFISMISSMPTVRTLIPLLPSGMEMEGDEIFKLTSKDVRMR